ncbi:MAG: signal peptidase II [Oscillospiraceae bacterium]|nr:signal peptidase II [Oscillospiraceae bacterium]
MKSFARKEKIKTRLLTFLTIILLVGIDRFTKQLITAFLELGDSITLIKIGGNNILSFKYVQNTGAAFSILQGQRLFLIIVSGLLVIGVLIFLMSDKTKNKLLYAALILLASGGMGNLADRAFYGYVIDFIYIEFINFAIFNFADICAVTGSFIAVFALFREELKNKRENENEKQPLKASSEASEADE